MPRTPVFAIILCAAAATGMGTAQTPPAGQAKDRLAMSAAALRAFRQNAPETARKLLDRASCIGVAPRRDSGQDAVDARGFVSCRTGPNAAWSDPAAIAITGGGVFWPVVGASIDLIILTANQPAAAHFGDAELVLGVALESAPGPVRPDQVPPASVAPALFAYQQSDGEITGISIEGATISEDKNANSGLYGKALDNAAILRRAGGGPDSDVSQPFLAALPAAIAGR